MSRRWMLVSGAMLFVVAGGYWWTRPAAPPPLIVTYHGDEPIEIHVGSCTPVSSRAEARELSLPVLKPDDLVAIRGELTGPCLPILVEILGRSSKGKEISEQSAAFGPRENKCDPMPFEIKLNVPRKSGEYTFQLKTPPDQHLVWGKLKIAK